MVSTSPLHTTNRSSIPADLAAKRIAARRAERLVLDRVAQRGRPPKRSPSGKCATNASGQVPERQHDLVDAVAREPRRAGARGTAGSRSAAAASASCRSAAGGGCPRRRRGRPLSRSRGLGVVDDPVVGAARPLSGTAVGLFPCRWSHPASGCIPCAAVASSNRCRCWGDCGRVRRRRRSPRPWARSRSRRRPGRQLVVGRVARLILAVDATTDTDPACPAPCRARRALVAVRPRRSSADRRRDRPTSRERVLGAPQPP